MAKAKQTQTPAAGHKAQAQARKPSAVTVVTPTPAPNPAAVLAQALAARVPVVATPATAMAAMAATLANPTAPKAPTVAVRGGLAIQAVRLTGVVYRVGCTHNATWWQQCQQAVQAGNGSATVQALVAAGVPAIFVGYVVRRGYMAPVAA